MRQCQLSLSGAPLCAVGFHHKSTPVHWVNYPNRWSVMLQLAYMRGSAPYLLRGSSWRTVDVHKRRGRMLEGSWEVFRPGFGEEVDALDKEVMRMTQSDGGALYAAHESALRL
jgi:hypothetical protein